MSIPDYHISRIVLDEQMQRQFNENDPRENRSRRNDPERHPRTRTARSFIATTIYRLARLVDPAPSRPGAPASTRTSP